MSDYANFSSPGLTRGKIDVIRRLDRPLSILQGKCEFENLLMVRGLLVLSWVLFARGKSLECFKELAGGPSLVT